LVRPGVGYRRAIGRIIADAAIADYEKNGTQ
jgi:hypothetical protein